MGSGETPVLIMHNDRPDGSVPWYQGIEMFMALNATESASLVIAIPRRRNA